MSKKFITTALVGLTIASSAALAAAQNKVGEIRSTDASKNEVVLTTGDAFQLPKSFKIETLKAGEKVKITYESKDGKMMATHVKPEK